MVANFIVTLAYICIYIGKVKIQDWFKWGILFALDVTESKPHPRKEV